MSDFVKTGKGFEFNPKTHRYYLDGKQMTGVTTILGVIAKPQLIKWSADQAVEYVKSHAKMYRKDGMFDGDYIVKMKELMGVLEEARKAWTIKRDAAADKGTDTHAECEQFIQCRINGLDWGTDSKQVQHFIDWADKHDVQFLDSEVQVYSEKHFVAGTYDFSCIIDGKKYLGDIKTSNALYPEYFYQCAAYRMMAEEMGQKDFSGSILVRIGRDEKFDEDKDVIISHSYKDEKEAFLSALKLYRTTARYKKTWGNAL